ncbi:hypothetical protein PDESU_05075 [Pontiella desulfatans]|uniref:DUF362 domain-containing protein n=1 Tax=Pontiella desulfatans TaxID=2750659 RepID=A0A6C2UAU4_PONDE|nr:DUF362 domain-containing protein [Pontiella desulfatans]VGO16484.1 hypothetical protein PDESU_05075 [Pontiella desulfatans]
MTDNPLNPNPERPEVHVVHGADAYANTLTVLDAFDLTAVNGKTVLLKPNVGRMSEVGSGVNTNPKVVAAAIDAFRAAGAIVSIGESPITGVKTMEAFELSGIADVAREKDCPLIDMDERKPVITPVPEGKVIDSLKICADVFDFDFVVSIPVMKIHMHTGATLSIKNMKGCLWRRSKVDLHMLPQLEGTTDKSLDIAIGDMAGVLRPHFALIDGSIGLEGLGPGAGTPKELNVVLAGGDGFAADAVACRLMGRKAEEIPHLRIGAANGFGIIDLDRIRVSPDSWQDYASEFKAAPKNLSFEFPNIEVLDKNSCSACQSTLLLFLQRFGESLADYIPEDEPLRVAIGKGHDELPDGTLCIGQCTIRQKEGGIFVPGCPPVGSQIFKTLQQHAEDESSNP